MSTFAKSTNCICCTNWTKRWSVANMATDSLPNVRVSTHETQVFVLVRLASWYGCRSSFIGGFRALVCALQSGH